jgi:all-trans-8'-apo-beta-carotenal 15,15'-oxygenase
MIASRRSFLMGAAALSAAVVTPDLVRAAQAAASTPDWALATADVEADIAPRALSLVHGRAPEGLQGVLFRNGPAKFRRPGGSAGHWFDGDGLVRRFAIEDGQAQLSARFVATRKRAQEERLGAMVMPGFGTAPDPRAEIGSPDDANAANTSVIMAGNDLWALWEAGSPVAMDPVTLETRDYVTLRPDLRAMPFLAHPRIEPDGRIWNLGMGGGQAVVWRLAHDGTLEDASVVPIPRASYVHDFTATARHLIIVLQPWVQERQTMPFSEGFAWRPETGTQVLVIDKADLSQRRIHEIEAFGFFHLGDAWEDGDTIRFDIAVHQDMSFAAHGATQVIEGVPQSSESAYLAMVTLTPGGGGRVERLPVIAEFPRSDPRRAGLARSLTVHTTGDTPGTPFARTIGLTDWTDATTRTFDFGAGQVLDEMVFVPKPGSTSEHDAWLIGPSLNLTERTTELHVLDVARIEDGPVATWRADVALPAAFHGTWAG